MLYKPAAAGGEHNRLCCCWSRSVCSRRPTARRTSGACLWWSSDTACSAVACGTWKSAAAAATADPAVLWAVAAALFPGFPSAPISGIKGIFSDHMHVNSIYMSFIVVERTLLNTCHSDCDPEIYLLFQKEAVSRGKIMLAHALMFFEWMQVKLSGVKKSAR